MDLEDRLLEARTSLSRIAAGLLAGIAIVAAYLLERAVGAMTWTGLMDSQPRGPYPGVSFSALSPSVFWPLVLGGLCLAFGAVVEKRKVIHEALRRLPPRLDPKTFEGLDPFSFDLSGHPGGFRVVRLFLLLPAISIMALLASQIISFLRGAGHVGESILTGEFLSELISGFWGLINLLLQGAALVLGFLAVQGFPAKGLAFLGFDAREADRRDRLPEPPQGEL